MPLGTNLELRPINSIHHNPAHVSPCPVRSVPETSNLHVLPGISTAAGTSQRPARKEEMESAVRSSMANLPTSIGRIG